MTLAVPESGLLTAAAPTAGSSLSSSELSCRPEGRRKIPLTLHHPDKRQPPKGLWKHLPGANSFICY